MSRKEGALSRREFVRIAGTLGVGTSIGATGCGSIAAGARPTQAAARPATETIVPPPGAPLVPRRAFGRAGTEVSVLALGGFLDVDSNFALLTSALASGVTYWETTLRYGGKGYGQYFQQHPGTRERVFLLGKAAGASTEQLDRYLSRVLAEAGVDRVDFFVIQGLDDPARLNREVQRWVAQEKARGRLRYFGFSTHSNMSRCLRAAAGMDWIDGVMTSYNYRLMQDAAMQEAVAACHERGVALTAIKAQALPTNPQATLGEETPAAKSALEAFGTGASTTPFQIKLKAVWSDPRIASICSMMTEERTLAENVAAAADGRAITRLHREALESYGRLTARHYCTGCSDICEPAVGRAVPIAALMRSLMYARGYGDPAMARSEWSALSPEAKQAVLTCDYSNAEARCPQGMAIGELMRATPDVLT